VEQVLKFLRGGPMRYRRDIQCVLASLLCFLAGCATQSHTPNTDAGTIELKIKAGDEIRVVTTRRERLTFEVTDVRADRFVGVTVKPRKKEQRPAGETVEVPFDELALLEVTRFDAGATALVTAAALVTVSAFAVVLGAVPPALPAGP
jgi:hypothetical protein